MNFLPIHWLFGWLFAQYLFVFFKSLLLNYFLKRSSLYIVESFSLQISNQQPMNISVTGKKVKSIWIHNHTIILNPQGKPIFFNCINFYNLYTYIYIYIYIHILTNNQYFNKNISAAALIKWRCICANK